MPMRSVTRWIQTVSIKAKVLGGFGCVLVILLAVAGIGYWRFLGVETSFVSYAQRVGVVAIGRDIDRDLSELRRHVREFAIVGNPDEATAAMVFADRVKAEIDRGAA